MLAKRFRPSLNKSILKGMLTVVSIGSVIMPTTLLNSAYAESVTVTAPSNQLPSNKTANATATSVNTQSTHATTNNNLQSHSVDDMVAIAKAGQQNEAINDAVLGNEAIRDTLNNDAIAVGSATSKTTNINASGTAPTIPRQSTQAGVQANQLILNNPVVDQARVLSASEKQALETKIRSIYQRGLAQIAVVIVPTTNGQDIFDYAMQVAEKWKLGKKGVDNGILILVSVNDRDMYILTGYGVEGVIPDAIAKRIISEDITPYFKQGDYAGGLTAGINRIEERLATDPDVLKQADAQKQTTQQISNISPIPVAIIGLFVGMLLTSILGRFLGATLTAGGVLLGGTVLGAGFFASVIIAILLFLFLLMRGGGGGRGGRGGGGFVILPGGGFGGGGFGGGGFGGGGFGGGGGGFGGGGAGGSW